MQTLKGKLIGRPQLMKNKIAASLLLLLLLPFAGGAQGGGFYQSPGPGFRWTVHWEHLIWKMF